MKTKKLLLMALAAVCAMTMVPSFTSCTSDNPDKPVTPDEPKELADATIIFYGCGGSNLDWGITDNLLQMYQASRESYQKVKVAVEYKFSTAENLEENFSELEGFIDTYKAFGGQTLRFVLDPKSDWTSQRNDPNSILGEPNCRIACPDSLTNFINWAARQCPAKKYILVLSDHGTNYIPHNELPENSAGARAIIYDDGNNDEHFTTKSLCRAIANASIRPDAIIFDACFMNNLETLFEIRKLCDYVVAYTYTTPGLGILYDALIDCTATNASDIVATLTSFAQATIGSWDYEDMERPNYRNLTVTRTAMLDAFGGALRAFTDRLCNTYENGTDEQRRIIDMATSEAVKIDKDNPVYDAGKYITNLSRLLPEVFDSQLYEQFSGTLNDCIVAEFQSSYLKRRNYRVNYSVMLANKGGYNFYIWDQIYVEEIDNWYNIEDSMLRFNADGTVDFYKGTLSYDSDGNPYTCFSYIASNKWDSTLHDTYCQLEFDRIVGWSRWLMLNKQCPKSWGEADFGYPLPDEDLSDVNI